MLLVRTFTANYFASTLTKFYWWKRACKSRKYVVKHIQAVFYRHNTLEREICVGSRKNCLVFSFRCILDHRVTLHSVSFLTALVSLVWYAFEHFKILFHITKIYTHKINCTIFKRNIEQIYEYLTIMLVSSNYILQKIMEIIKITKRL